MRLDDGFPGEAGSRVISGISKVTQVAELPNRTEVRTWVGPAAAKKTKFEERQPFFQTYSAIVRH
jgi:hypothetical protein